LVHYLGVILGGRVQNCLTLIKLTVIAVFALGGLLWGAGDWSHLSLAGGGWRPGQMALALIFVSFAYSGWNAAAYLGSEIRRPGRNIPRALIGGTLIVAVVYLVLNLVYLYALPPRAMAGVLEVGGAAAAALFGPGIGRALSLAIAVGLLSVISSMVLTGPRVYYAMAIDGIFFPALGRVTERRHTPAAAIWLQAGLASAMVLTASFDKLLIYMGFTLSLMTMLTVVGLMIIRRRQGAAGVSYRTWGYPVTPLIYILGNLWIVAWSVTSRPVVCLTGLVTVASGLAVYAYFRRRSRGRA
jgi:APA family basic amino acid/polyamine antiporter